MQRIDERKRREEKKGRESRSLRHRLIDLVMEEVESLPELSSPQKKRIRHKMGRLADPHAGLQTEYPPPTPQHHPQQQHVAPEALPAPPSTIEQAVVTVVEPQVEEEQSPQPEDDPLYLAGEIQRLLSLNTDEAVKIVSYVQALMTTTPDSHQVDLDI